MPSFFFRELQLITVLLLVCDSYMSRSTRFVYLKQCVRYFIFESVSFLLKFIFLFNKMHGLFDFQNVKTPLKIKILEKLHTVLLVFFFNFKLQQPPPPPPLGPAR